MVLVFVLVLAVVHVTVDDEDCAVVMMATAVIGGDRDGSDDCEKEEKP